MGSARYLGPPFTDRGSRPLSGERPPAAGQGASRANGEVWTGATQRSMFIAIKPPQIARVQSPRFFRISEEM